MIKLPTKLSRIPAASLLGVVVLGVVGGTPPPAAASSAPAPALTLVADVPQLRVQQGQTIRPAPEVLPVSHYELTGRFGQSSGLWSTVHTGLDFAVPSGAEIQAIAAGTVVSSGYDGAYGLKTVIATDDGTELWFCHQDSVTVSVGQRVAAGEVIGTVGTSGNVTGPHLHLEVRPAGGEPVDPEAALARWGLHA